MLAAVFWGSGQAEPSEITPGVEQLDDVVPGQQAQSGVVRPAEIPTHAFSNVLPFVAVIVSMAVVHLHVHTIMSLPPMCLTRPTGHVSNVFVRP